MTPEERSAKEKEAVSIEAEANMVIANAILECRRLKDLAARKSSDKRRRKLRDAEARLRSLNDQREEMLYKIRVALEESL